MQAYESSKNLIDKEKQKFVLYIFKMAFTFCLYLMAYDILQICSAAILTVYKTKFCYLIYNQLQKCLHQISTRNLIIFKVNIFRKITKWPTD